MIDISPYIKEIAKVKASHHFFDRRKLLIGGGVLVSSSFMGPSIILAQTEQSEGARKINLSGRQRMLIQRAGKFVCLAFLVSQPRPLLAAAKQAISLHQKTEAGLLNGDDKLGLTPESDPLVREALTRASDAFKPYGQTIRDAVRRHAVDHEHLHKILELNDQALREMDAAVNLIERVYKNRELSERMAMIINIAGRQRMFTQRLVLLLGLIRSGIGSYDTRQELFRTMNRFSRSLNILQRITPDALQSERVEKIIQQLSAAQGTWEALTAYFSTAVLIGTDQSIDDILNADKQAEGLLERMNEIVLLYEDAAS